MIRIHIPSISFNKNDLPCIVFDDCRTVCNSFDAQRKLKPIDPTKRRQETDKDESIHNPEATVTKTSKAARVLHSHTNLTSDHSNTMRRFYRNLKPSGNKIDRMQHRRIDKLKEPDAKHPIIKEQPFLKENHEPLHVNGPTESSLLTLQPRANGRIDNTCNENVDDGTSLRSVKAHMDEKLIDLSIFQDLLSVTNEEIKDADDVQDDEESLLGLQFLHDDDEIDDHAFTSLPSHVDRSFCISSDSDAYSTDTVDTASGVSD